MGKHSNIGWTDHTFNGWKGCVKVAKECAACYAEAWGERFGQVKWGHNVPRIRTKTWGNPVKWNREAEKNGKVQTVFAFSLGDVFEDKPDQPELNDWRADFWMLIQDTPWLDWMILTKRAENVMRMIPYIWANNGLPDNVLIGTSVGTQERTSQLFYLRDVPARRKFVSAEPLLETVNFKKAINPVTGETENALAWGMIDQLIVGGESDQGKRKARPFPINSATVLLHHARQYNIPFFFKQMGNNAMHGNQKIHMPADDKKGEKLENIPAHLRVRQPYTSLPSRLRV